MNVPAQICGAQTSELARKLRDGHGRARSVWRLLREGHDPRGHQSLSPKIHRELSDGFASGDARVVAQSTASCQTTKLLVQIASGEHVETVLIPTGDRTTVCISSQVGCARGCTFCVTAAMGLKCNLSAGEIVAQVILAMAYARKLKLPEVRNIVYMGMGEPLDNWKAVEQSVGVLRDPYALNLGKKQISVSTVGPSPRRILELGEVSALIAWSVHAVDDRLRRELVPTTRHPMAQLRDAFVELMAKRRDQILIEMALVDGVNDHDRHADALVEFLHPLPCKVRVNLIPVNPGRGVRGASMERTRGFAKRLQEQGMFCSIRTPRGTDADAACGQLATSITKATGVEAA